VAIQKAIEGAGRPGRRPGAEGVPGHAHPDRDIARPRPRPPDMSTDPVLADLPATVGPLTPSGRPRAGATESALAVSRSCRPARRGDHRLPDCLHGMDEPSRVVRLELDPTALHRPGEPQDPPRRPTLPEAGADRYFTVIAVAAETVLGVAMALLFNRVLGAGPAPHAGHPADGGTPTAIALVSS
jgi:hypothetical protein